MALRDFILTLFFLALVSPNISIDPITTLDCHRRQYSYKVQQTDAKGLICWDHINVMSCWGRCDSNEIADWKFPYKRSHHPVCLHESTQENQVTLRNCDPGAAPETRIYTFQEAATCSCSFCRSSEASCEGLRYRGARRAPRQAKRSRWANRDWGMDSSTQENAVDIQQRKSNKNIIGESMKKFDENEKKKVENLRQKYETIIQEINPKTFLGMKETEVIKRGYEIEDVEPPSGLIPFFEGGSFISDDKDASMDLQSSYPLTTEEEEEELSTPHRFVLLKRSNNRF